MASESGEFWKSFHDIRTQLPDDPARGASSLCSLFLKAYTESGQAARPELAALGIAVYSCLVATHEEEGFPSTIESFIPSGVPKRDVHDLVEVLSKARETLSADEARATMGRYREEQATMLQDARCYELTDGDLDRAQQILNELRDLLTRSETIPEDHKRRLLARLEKLQAELHKRMRSLVRFWAVIVEAGMVLGRFGEDVKPLVDRIRELTGIACRTQLGFEGMGQLPAPDDLLGLEEEQEA